MERFIALAMATLLLQGCCGILPIPLGKSITEHTIMGQRLDDDGKPVEKVQRNCVEKAYWELFGFDGGGKFYDGYYEYFLIKGEDAARLPFLEDDLSWQYLKEFLPVEGTNKWIAFHHLNTTRETFDIEMVIFDQKGIIHNELVRNSKRRKLGQFTLWDHSIAPKIGNAIIEFETVDGVRVFDVNARSWIYQQTSSSISEP